MLPGFAVDPDELVAQARAEHRPVASFCLFSGGSDSTVVAHRCRDHYQELAWIDTGTALPGVEDFVVDFAMFLDKPLRIVRHDFDAYRLVVLGGEDWKGDVWEGLGFPGPANHGTCYNRLKERAIEALLRQAKVGHPRSARVMFLTGVRRAESARRAKRRPVNRKAGQVFVNPLIDWTNADMRAYRARYDLPESDVAALLHRSGECNCGAFAAPGDRDLLRSLFPDWWAERMAPLEAEAEARGKEFCRWGETRHREPAVADAADLCSDCQLRLDGVDDA